MENERGNNYPIRIFIGTSESEWLPAKVLEYSIKCNTKAEVEFVHLNQASHAVLLPQHKKNYPRTPFSFQRFLIPALCGYQGRAIYLDADMLVFSDIDKLWSMDFDGADLLYVGNRDASRPPQFSVMLLSCESLHWNVESIVNDLNNETYTYNQLMYQMIVAHNPQNKLPWSWNSMEFYEEGSVDLLHYTDMNTQPWVNTKNRNGELWLGFLRLAIKDGFISLSDVENQIREGFIRPSLMLDLNGEEKTIKNIFYYIRCFFYDISFKAPYKKLKRGIIVRLFSRLHN